MPPLASLLAALSVPKPFSSIIISHGRRALYIDALVWMLSNDLVVELRTYFRLVATTETKTKAAQREGQLRRSSIETIPTKPLESPAIGLASSAPVSIPGASAPVPMLGASAPGSDKMYSPGISPGSFRKRPLAREMSGYLSTVSLKTDVTSASSDKAEYEAFSVISEPSQPTARERRWIEQIQLGKDAPVVQMFERMLPFLNGRYDLEEVLFRTDSTRKQIQTVLEAFQDHIILFEV